MKRRETSPWDRPSRHLLALSNTHMFSHIHPLCRLLHSHSHKHFLAGVYPNTSASSQCRTELLASAGSRINQLQDCDLVQVTKSHSSDWGHTQGLGSASPTMGLLPARKYFWREVLCEILQFTSEVHRLSRKCFRATKKRTQTSNGDARKIFKQVIQDQNASTNWSSKCVSHLDTDRECRHLERA